MLFKELFKYTVVISDAGICPGDPIPINAITDAEALLNPTPFYYLVVGNRECCEGSYGLGLGAEERPSADDCGGTACYPRCP